MATRLNEYFIPGDGISREVIQADICRYLGNDALVKPGTHNGQKGYIIRAYRNLTSEMIADLKADSAKWEAEVARRREAGDSRGTYDQDTHRSRSPNTTPPAPYPSSSIPDMRHHGHGGPSPPPYAGAPPPPSYSNQYPQQAYPGTAPVPPYTTGPMNPSISPYDSSQNAYAPPHPGAWSGPAPPPPVSAPDAPPGSYTFSGGNPGYPYEGRGAAPRYPGPYENDMDYNPVTSSMSHPAATTAPDARVSMDPRYTPENAYADPRAAANRHPPPRETPRRPR
ncbi:hypothetical protein VTN31DRAFT_4874 [Thermomyces dupontii]|uniref:uncharacterized protein n=1 Tax=Talaromyces thermophilus TaxID=28565 RepID=UPI003743F2DB